MFVVVVMVLKICVVVAAAAAACSLVDVATTGILMGLARRAHDWNGERRIKSYAGHRASVRQLAKRLLILIAVVLVSEASSKGVFGGTWTPLLVIHIAGCIVPFLVFFALARWFNGDQYPYDHWKYSVPCVVCGFGIFITGAMLLLRWLR